MKHSELTADYLQRPVDSRMVQIINTEFRAAESVVDLACGSGLYGAHLRRIFPVVYGIDYNPDLVRNAQSTNSYTDVVCASIENLAGAVPAVNAVFCSEFLEHVDNDALMGILTSIESVAQDEIVITVPNPRSPHFRNDPTHILKYNIRGLLSSLNSSDKFSYVLRPLGFSEYNLAKPHYRLLNVVSRRIAALSPTVLYVGRRR
jgi:trans-aconitate methyltransferase